MRCLENMNLQINYRIADFQCHAISRYKLKPFNRLSPESVKKNEGKCVKTLAKIQITGIFLKRDMRRNVLPKLIETCMETPCWCHLHGHQHGSRKPTETSVTEFCCKSVNSSLEELKTIKIIPFLLHELFR